MAQDRGRRSAYGGGRRDDYETDDLRFADRGRGYGGERDHESGRSGYGGGQQRGESFSRGGWSGQPTGDYGSRQQSGDWFGDSDYESRGYGQGGYGAQEERYRSGHSGRSGGYDRDYAHGGFMSGGGYAGGGLASRWYGAGDRMRGAYGPGGGDYPNSGQGGSHPGRRDYGDHERGFMEKASDEVASWFGDEEAEQRRRMDHRGRGPRGYVRSDERIREDVNDRLTDDWMLDASDIEVEVRDREVTLSGQVSSRSDKRRAEDIAEDVSGVTHVQNNLRIRRTEDGGVTGVTL